MHAIKQNLIYSFLLTLNLMLIINYLLVSKLITFLALLNIYLNSVYRLSPINFHYPDFKFDLICGQ